MKNQKLVKAVIFDLGGTIIKSAEPAQIFRRILEAHGIHVQTEKIRTAHRKNETEHDPEDMAQQGIEYWNRWNMRLLKTIGIDENRELLARRINEQWFDYADLQVFPHVAETLEELKRRGVKLGVVTNALAEEIEKMFKKLNLNNIFDVAVGCDACKKAKPSREIFCYALDRLKVRPENAVFVGDSIKYDYEGAKEAGMKTVLISRDGDAPVSVESVTNLNEILRHID